MKFYDFYAKSIDEDMVTFDKFEGKVVLIANTASKCGFTPQYEELQKLYTKYNGEGFEVLGFPCNQFEGQEPGQNSEVKNFCTVNYGVTFPLFEKIDVRGKNAHPIFRYLIEKAPFKGFDLESMNGKLVYQILQEKYPELLVGDSIKWNFTKFLIDRKGNVVKRYESTVSPMDIEDDIKQLLNQ